MKRHPMAVAIDKFLESDEGKACIAPGAHGQYLANRIKTAFAEGWNACERHIAPKTMRRVRTERKP